MKSTITQSIPTAKIVPCETTRKDSLGKTKGIVRISKNLPIRNTSLKFNNKFT